jgi:hypothetical protein
LFGSQFHKSVVTSFSLTVSFLINQTQTNPI